MPALNRNIFVQLFSWINILFYPILCTSAFSWVQDGSQAREQSLRFPWWLRHRELPPAFYVSVFLRFLTIIPLIVSPFPFYGSVLVAERVKRGSNTFAAPFCMTLRLWKTISSLSDCRLNIISLGVFKIGIVRAYLYFIPLLRRPFIIDLSKTTAIIERPISYARYAAAYRYTR